MFKSTPQWDAFFGVLTGPVLQELGPKPPNPPEPFSPRIGPAPPAKRPGSRGAVSSLSMSFEGRYPWSSNDHIGERWHISDACGGSVKRRLTLLLAGALIALAPSLASAAAEPSAAGL